MATEYSMLIAKAFISYMDSNGLKYTFDSDRGVIMAGFAVSKDCIIGAVNVQIRIHESDFICSGICPIHAPANRRAAAAELLTRLNWVLRDGNFEMDYSDGEIRYKVYVDCEGLVPTHDVIEAAINIPPSMFKQYGQCIADVITSGKDPEAAFNDRRAGQKSQGTSSESPGTKTDKGLPTEEELELIGKLIDLLPLDKQLELLKMLLEDR